jgi:hypothetical protein
MASKILPVILLAVVVWLGAQVWRGSSDGLRRLSVAVPAKPKAVPASARPGSSDFTLPSSQGEMFQLAAYKGKSPVVMEFFATW